MAQTQIADIYEPLTFNAAIDEGAIELNRFYAAGAIQEDPLLTDMAAMGGRIGELPFFKNLDTATDPDIMTDDPSDTATPDKITDAKAKWRLASLHKSWSTMDLARDLALKDPLAAIVSKVNKWWATQQEKRVIAAVNGLIAANAAQDSGDMINDIYSDIVTPLAANIISAEAVIDTAQTMGDHADALSIMIMHSVTFANLRKQNLIDYIPNARGEVSIPTYLGYTVVVDDSMPVATGSNSPKYTTCLMASGAIGHGKGRVSTPSEVDRVPNAGNGAGQDILHTRSSDIYHPYGFSFLSTSVAAESATRAELATAANWDRVYDRKLIGMAFLTHNN